MKHVQPGPVKGAWELVTSEGEPMEKLVLRCKILLSHTMGTDALRLQSPRDVLTCLLQRCSCYLSDTYKLRQMWGV